MAPNADETARSGGVGPGSGAEARGSPGPGHVGGYDEFAWLYDRYWGGISLAFVPALEHLVLDALPPRSRILDLACGTGQLAARLVEKGLRVTGLDSSPGMLAFARARAPGAEFVLADSRSLELPPTFDAVVSVFDSLNHIMSVEELRAVFARVRAAIVPGGAFVFDLNTEEAVGAGSSSSLVGEDHVAVVRTAYDPETRVMRFEAILFRPRDRHWERTDVLLFQRCHTEEEVRSALESAGFLDTVVVPGETFDLGPGRLFYAASVPR